MNGINILVVVREKKLADILHQGLSENGFSAQVAYEGMVGLRLFHHRIFSIVIVDFDLPDFKGAELLKAIRDIDPRVPVIMLTAMNEAANKIEGFASGADDYVIKPFDFQEVLLHIRNLMKRTNTKIATKVQLRADGLVMNIDNREVTRSGKFIPLTIMEFQLLEYMLRNKNRLLSHMDIALNVWDFSIGSETNVVDTYINYLRRKIDNGFETPLIHSQGSVGYILKDAEY